MFYSITKRIIDIISSVILITLLLPLLGIIYAIVSLDGYSAIYKHLRIGQHGKKFPCYKFRSMAVNSDIILSNYLNQNPVAMNEWNTTRKLNNDPRITKIGKFLRKTSIDELPQLFNVLFGHMSFVGPRPITEEELLERYRENAPNYLMVKPGITGLWQISGRSSTTYEKRVELDVIYSKHPSITNDMYIALKTPKAVISQTGAK